MTTNTDTVHPAYTHGFESTEAIIDGAPYSVRHELRQATNLRLATAEFGSDEYWVLAGASVALNLSNERRAA